MRALQASTSYSVGVGIIRRSAAAAVASSPRHPSQSDPTDKSVEIMRKFSESMLGGPELTSVLIKGLAEHKDTLVCASCPCRKECHCMLFLTPDNGFAGQETGHIHLDQEISRKKPYRLYVDLHAYIPVVLWESWDYACKPYIPTCALTCIDVDKLHNWC
ncbi:hypothetical protein BUALT_Bualt16G0014100 [Buddleja alternifolia]|uniref:Ferredoxin-thioredoxin reductase catalytic chain, chloroplastic n=1 Tax=Buddleja alternifolia TaxID=168488 RepID=A0AAV6W5W8_9LAMI|nr:hypothetical protein BUALT_Bualt16G0014100 [Buddleja alternifolia]